MSNHQSGFIASKVPYDYKGQKFSLLEASRKDERRFRQMAMYLKKYANVTVPTVYKIIENSPDTLFVARLRRRMKNNSEHKGCCICDQAQNIYDDSLVGRAKYIKELFDASGGNITGPKILDIGTENIKYLDALEEVFGPNCIVRGLNIDDGFNHYNDVTKFRDDRFRLYDGTNIPEDLTSDIITITAVLHHVPVENVGPLIKSMAARTKYVVIKENNLTDDVAGTLFMFQHYLFENMIRHEPLSYTNPDITLAIIDKHFADAGMRRLYIKESNNFNNTFYAVYGK